MYWFSSSVPVATYSKTQCIYGVLLFIFGELLNLRHHLILSGLRRKHSNHYQVRAI